MTPDAERKFDDLAGALIARCILFLLAVAVGTGLLCLAFELYYRPVGRWSHSQVIEKAVRYERLRNHIGAQHGMGIREAQVDSIFADSL